MGNSAQDRSLIPNRAEALILAGAFLAVVGCFLPWKFEFFGMISGTLAGIKVFIIAPWPHPEGNSLLVIILAVVVTGLSVGTFRFFGKQKVGAYLAIMLWIVVTALTVTAMATEAKVRDNGGASIILFTCIAIWFLLRPPSFVPRPELAGTVSALVAAGLAGWHLAIVSSGWNARLRWGLPIVLVGTILLLVGGHLKAFQSR